MKPVKITVVLLSIGLFAACGGGGEPTVPTAQLSGETSAAIGDHVVHFNALSTEQLAPDVARAYTIVRSKNRAMLNVSVLEAESGTAVTATVTVKTVNLTGQLKNVVMRKIQEQEAIYYIGETPVANRETLIFEITVIPDGTTEPHKLKFKRQFYSD